MNLGGKSLTVPHSTREMHSGVKKSRSRFTQRERPYFVAVKDDRRTAGLRLHIDRDAPSTSAAHKPRPTRIPLYPLWVGDALNG